MNILVITRWHPNSAEPVKCTFVKELHSHYSKMLPNDNITVISPIPYYPSILSRFLKTKYDKFLSVNDLQMDAYPILFPRYFKIPGKMFAAYEWYSYYLSLKRSISKLSSSFDIVHTHGLVPDGLVGRQIAKDLRVPLVSHAHDGGIDHFSVPEMRLAKKVCQDADAIIAVSDRQKMIIEQYLSADPDKVITINNGIDSRKFCVLESMNNTKKYFRLLSVGNLNYGKGFDILLGAIYLLQQNSLDISLTVVGEGVERDSLNKLIDSYQLINVKFLGAIPNNKLPQIYNQHDAFILSTRSETFGIVFIEALACGLPVVAPRIAPLTDILPEEFCIFADPESSSSFAEAIIIIKEKRWEKNRIAESVSKYSLQNSARELRRVYEKVLSYRTS
ncbi:MAG: hypothetical protein A2X43_05895 [Candidatus Margulisbacteria bacterium GWD2_39_127]|nr:MAG: hypothetical protein A2X43_05895 [Candidatus Margulisbacteria bacterium GWD2_39_127]